MTRIDRKYIVQPLLTRELEGEGPVGLAEELGERGELDFVDGFIDASTLINHSDPSERKGDRDVSSAVEDRGPPRKKQDTAHRTDRGLMRIREVRNNCNQINQ